MGIGEDATIANDVHLAACKFRRARPSPVKQIHPKGGDIQAAAQGRLGCIGAGLEAHLHATSDTVIDSAVVVVQVFGQLVMVTPQHVDEVVILQHRQGTKGRSALVHLFEGAIGDQAMQVHIEAEVKTEALHDLYDACVQSFAGCELVFALAAMTKKPAQLRHKS